MALSWVKSRGGKGKKAKELLWENMHTEGRWPPCKKKITEARAAAEKRRDPGRSTSAARAIARKEFGEWEKLITYASMKRLAPGLNPPTASGPL